MFIQAPQFLRSNITAVDDNLPPPPGMSLYSTNQHHQQFKHSEHSNEEKSAPMATTELSSDLQEMKLTTELGFDDDDDLPPPPPLSNISNLMPGLTSPTTSTSTSTSTLRPLGPLTLVEAPQNVQSLPSPPAMVCSTAPPPPPPPPPQTSVMTSSIIQSSAVPSFGGQSTSIRDALKPTEGRLNLLEEIRMGRQLKKVEKQKEKEEHLKALKKNDVSAVFRQRMETLMTPDVMAVLKNRMEKVRGVDSDNENEDEEDDGTWD